MFQGLFRRKGEGNDYNLFKVEKVTVEHGKQHYLTSYDPTKQLWLSAEFNQPGGVQCAPLVVWSMCGWVDGYLCVSLSLLPRMRRPWFVLVVPTSRAPRVALKEPDFFFLLRTALGDRPKGPPIANRQLPSTANRHQPPTTNRHQPPTTNRRQPPAATNRQLPTTANRHQPTAANHHQPPPTASCQLPTANRRQPPTANRQPPPTMVEHMECPRAFLAKLVPEHFPPPPPLRTALRAPRSYLLSSMGV